MNKTVFIIIIFIWTPFLFAKETVDYVDLTEWQFRWGDSPLDSAGIPQWTYLEQSDSWWMDIDVPAFYGPGQGHYIWLRTPIPENQWANPTMFLTACLYSLQVYVDSVHVYSFGDFFGDINKYDAMRWYMVPLGVTMNSKYIYFRIYSNQNSHIGIPLQADNRALIGPQWEIITFIIRNSIDRFVLGFLFSLIGLMSLDLFFHRIHEKPVMYLPFALFTFCIGISFFFSCEVSQFVVNNSVVRFAGSYIGVLMFPVGLFMFYEFVVMPVHKKIVRMLWQSLLVIGLSLIFLEFTGLVQFDSILYPVWVIIMLLSLVLALLFGFWGTIKGNVVSKSFNIGFIVMLLFTVHDILFMLGVVPYWHWMSEWGVLLFVLTLLHIIEQHNMEDHEKLIEYSRALKEHQNILETRVEERTRDLHEKNLTLEKTMTELQQTQQQLILKEKMASLGHLVAGVAHELNNPIGAIGSSGNVMQRGLKRVWQMIAKSSDKGLSQEVTPTWEILEQNTAIITEGSDRVARIVKSLKNFARLDEAEFQKADIHTGLDSTIELLHHDFKKRIKVNKEYGVLPKIHCFPNQLNQVFLNLLANAAQAIENEGEITVRTEVVDSTVIIKVADTGKGISAEHLDHVFDPGFTTKGVGVGTGLGLSISYNIIKYHRGEISVESGPGNGAEFTIKLPVIQK